QDFWLKHSSLSKTPVTSHTPVRIEAPGEIPKFIENSDLNAQLQERVFQLRKLKGKNVVNTVVSKPNATLAPGIWKPTGRNFTIIGNRCPLTRITSNKIVPPKETTIVPVVTPTSGILVYSRRPKATRSVGSSSKVKIVESKTSNSKEPKQSWGSTVSDVPSSSLNDCRLSKLFSGIWTPAAQSI
ncbi:hypothetical protein Tco_0814457, partial [Tanacetum coccineum]